MGVNGMKVESYNIFIGINLVLCLIAGVFTGVNYHDKDSQGMFISLFVGFVFLCITYYLIEKREEIVIGSKITIRH